jgi:radical SAM protein with 4Fe4S-binding SPASM domain
MIKIAKVYKVDTKIDSNLNQFTEEDAEAMILSGLDKLIVSIDGATRETYSKYRINGDFDKVIGNLGLLVRKKREMKMANPFISWQFLVFRHNEHEIEQAKTMAADMGVDGIGITKAFIGDKDWLPSNEEYSYYKKGEIGGREHTSNYFKPFGEKFCNWPWEAIVVNPNGSVSPCCSVEDEAGDFGNIFNSPFRDIWNNSNYKEARSFIKNKLMPEGKRENICLSCRHSGLTNLDILSCHSLFTQLSR